MAFDKVRIRFRKGGDLRLVSHHDLMRCFERMLRRASLPIRSTSGFHPKPRLVFALSLPLGVVGRDEVAELELTEPIDPTEIHTRLADQAPPGLEIISVRRIDPKAGAQVRRASYRVALPANRAEKLSERITALLCAMECWLERTRPHHRRYNLRPYLDQLRLEPDALEMDLWVTPTGAARADEVVVLDADGDRLGVAEPVGGGVAAGAGVVVVQPRDLVEPEHPAQIGELWQISSEIRGMVQHKQLNLLQDFSHLGKFDVIFCRNVLIYFDQETKTNIFGRLARIVEPDGFLVLGAAETVVGLTEAFKPIADRRGLYRPNNARAAVRPATPATAPKLAMAAGG